jgi:hypothetical protein
LKLTRFSRFNELFLERMFVVDKHGGTIFFPWGPRKNGYVLDNPNMPQKFAKFYLASYTVYIISTILSILAAGSVVGMFGAVLICSALWILVNRLYTNRFVKSLPAAKSSYADLILEKITPDEAGAGDDDPSQQQP